MLRCCNATLKIGWSLWAYQCPLHGPVGHENGRLLNLCSASVLWKICNISNGKGKWHCSGGMLHQSKSDPIFGNLSPFIQLSQCFPSWVRLSPCPTRSTSWKRAITRRNQPASKQLALGTRKKKAMLLSALGQAYTSQDYGLPAYMISILCR